MMGTRAYALSFGIFFLMFILVGAWFYVPSYLFLVTRCSFSFDHSITECAKQSITDFVCGNSINKSFMQFPTVSLKKDFSYVSFVDARYYAGGIVHCHVKMHRPMLIINDAYVLMDNGCITDKVVFSTYGLDSIPSLLVQDLDTSMRSPFFLACIKNIPGIFFDRFYVRWIDHTCIALHDKMVPNSMAIAYYQSTFDNNFIKNYESIQQELMHKKSSSGRLWKIDMRFKNQIIVDQKNMGGL